jgi:hypothetical protein
VAILEGSRSRGQEQRQGNREQGDRRAPRIANEPLPKVSECTQHEHTLGLQSELKIELFHDRLPLPALIVF